MASDANNLPDTKVVFSNELAVEFLRDQGLLGRVQQNSCGPRYDVFLLCYYGHGTHWIFALHIDANPDEGVNGYLVSAFPKSQFGRSCLAEGVSRARAGAGAGCQIQEIHIEGIDRSGPN